MSSQSPSTSDALGEPLPPTTDDADLRAPAVPFLHRRGAPRWRIESLLVRLVATSGIIGVSVALAAILGTQDVHAWIIGLTVSTVSVTLAALLWSSRTL
jgi:protein-S-isoprenylcysteine O-methyltransferase Ste14